eukprot:14153163-Heterocapsa_arctica.AAC.1
MVHQKLSHGIVRNTRELRSVSVSQWAAQYSGLTELRDLREIQTLAYVMDLVNMRDMEQAMDVLAQRVIAIQQAKRK